MKKHNRLMSKGIPIALLLTVLFLTAGFAFPQTADSRGEPR